MDNKYVNYSVSVCMSMNSSLIEVRSFHLSTYLPIYLSEVITTSMGEDIIVTVEKVHNIYNQMA